jgi:transposase-like protein
MTVEQVVSYLLEEEGLDFLRESLTWVVQQLMEAEVSELVGAARGEQAPEERLTPVRPRSTSERRKPRQKASVSASPTSSAITSR